jgi:peptidoglycan/xylan/chitin deacetylase (PgdA/CDA1 family)
LQAVAPYEKKNRSLLNPNATGGSRMRFASPFLKRVVYPIASKSGYLHQTRRIGPAILTYHGIFPTGYQPGSTALDGHLITPARFREHMRLLKAKYNLISPQQFRSCVQGGETCPPRTVLLTCDDGLVNVLTDMLPIIQELDLPLLLFVTGASALQAGSMLWYEKLYLWLQEAHGVTSVQLAGMSKPIIARSDLQWRPIIRELSQFSQEEREQFLGRVRTQLGIPETWESEYSQNESLRRRFFVLQATELRELWRAGVTIGAHTLSHPMLPNMPTELAHAEIASSRAQIESVIGEPVWAFAYPFGDRDSVGDREAGLAQSAGFECAFTNTEAAWGNTNYRLPRIHVSTETTTAELEAHVSGFYGRIRGLL